jgi:translation initiation factor IF-2
MREFNVGIQTIVDLLKKNGFEVESKPNVKLSDEMYHLLLREFQKDIAIKKQADEISIGIRKAKEDEVPAPATPEKPKEAAPAAPAPPAPEPAPVVVESPPVVASAPAPAPPPVEEKPAEPEGRAPGFGLKIQGKVDLDSLKPKKKERSAEPAKTKEPAPPVAEPQAETPPPAAPVQPETPPAPPAEAPAPAPAPVEATGELSEEPKIDDTYRAESPQLRGLKILGKVDLDSKKDKDKKKKKTGKGSPAGSATPETGAVVTDRPKPAVAGDAESADKKKRRKRKKLLPGETESAPDKSGVAKKPAAAPTTGDKRKTTVRKDGEVRELSAREIEDKVRLTMMRVQGSGKKKKKFGTDRKSRDERKEQLRSMEDGEESRLLEVTEFISVSELASLMDVSPTDVITTCMSVGVFVSINQRLDAEIIDLVASEFGFTVKFISAEDQIEKEQEEIEVEDPADLLPRAPIVTVMGHVDHGKTSLLDSIRKANVAGGEAGGITQHIGAYEVYTHGGKITFLDTPGHEAFTAMRARGAKVTDIAVVVVAADDNVMPQTREAISHAQAAGVPIVFAINKIDKDGAKPEKIKEELASMNLLVEDWGGTYQSQDISAKKGIGVEELLEKILIQAEMLELKANPNRKAAGAVIEASLDKGRGFVSKILVQTGTLEIGDPVVAGSYSGKVKAMFNERGQRVKQAGPSTPVLVLGLGGAPQAGEKFKVMESEQEARALANKRAQLSREQEIRATKRITLKDIGRRLALGSFKQLNLIVKGDVDGSVEALSDSLLKLSTETVMVNIVHKAVGQVTESDVLLASASDAIIVAFNVRPSPNARKLAEQEGVEVKPYSVIYDAIDEIKAAIEGMLEPTKEEKITCNIDVREVFSISKVGTIAGCYVSDGLVTRKTLIRVVRDGIVVFPVKPGQVGELSSLKRFKDDVKEVRTGFECGVMIKDFNDIRVGDNIEGYEIIEVKQKLS